MPRKRPVSLQCTAIALDGKQCGGRDRSGAQPPLCNIHRAQQAGHKFVNLNTHTPFDPQAKLEKIARNDRHPQQLQAIKMLRDTDACPKCKARAEREPSGFEISKLPPEKQAELTEALATVRRLTREVKPDLPQGFAERKLEEAQRAPSPPAPVIMLDPVAPLDGMTPEPEQWVSFEDIKKERREANGGQN